MNNLKFNVGDICCLDDPGLDVCCLYVITNIRSKYYRCWDIERKFARNIGHESLSANEMVKIA